MFKSLPKGKYPTGMLYFLTGHTFIIYVQYIKGSKRKSSYLLEKLFEKDLVHFVSDSIFKRLKFDYSSSKIVSEYDQEIPQSQTADNPVAPQQEPLNHYRDTRKTNLAKQPALFSPSR